MKEELLTKSDVTRIIEHMNEDHEDALISYVKFYGKVGKCNKAKLIKMNSKSMDIEYYSETKKHNVVLPFDHELASAHDAHMTMVKMAKLAM